MLCGIEQFKVLGRYIELFLYFANARLLARFACFKFSTGKLPAAFEFAVTSLGGEDLIAAHDDGCCHVEGLQGALLSRCVSLTV